MKKLTSKAPDWIAAASVLLFIALGVWNLCLPGLQYDEALFINAALGGITDSFVHRRLFGIPVMLMPYIGALKAYLFAPVFALFGVSVETIRLPAIALSSVSVLLGYKLGCLTMGDRWLGAMLSLLMATDPIFVFMSRSDYGPIVLMALAKLAAIVALYKLLQRPQARFAWALTISLLLGLFDKLNFVWIIIAIFIGAAIVYREEFVSLARKRAAVLWIAATTLLAGFTVIAVTLIVPLLLKGGGVGATDWKARLHYTAQLYQNTMNAQAINSMMLGAEAMPSSPTSLSEGIALAGLALLIVISVAARSLDLRAADVSSGQSRVKGRRKSLVFFVILFVLILLQLAITREATGSHHVMALWPFHHLILLLVGAVLADCLAPRIAWLRGINVPRAILTAPGALIVLAFTVSQFKVTKAYDSAFVAAESSPAIWTKAIYPLAEHISRTTDTGAVICVDWGICNQVFALSPNVRAKTKDIWPVFVELNRGNNGQTIFDHFFKGQKTMVILRAGNSKVMSEAYDNFKQFAVRYLGDPAPTKIVSDGNGQPVLEVYEISN